jgi:hypothetical protein
VLWPSDNNSETSLLGVTHALADSSQLQLGDAPADVAPFCAEVTSDDAGAVEACPCVRIGSGPAPTPDDIACENPGQVCSYIPHGCGVVSCTCSPTDAGFRWACLSLLG